MGINFPNTKEGDFLRESIRVTGEQDDRSNSKIVYNLIRDHFNDTTDEFKSMVNDRVAQEKDNDSQGEGSSVGDALG